MTIEGNIFITHLETYGEFGVSFQGVESFLWTSQRKGNSFWQKSSGVSPSGLPLAQSCEISRHHWTVNSTPFHSPPVLRHVPENPTIVESSPMTSSATGRRRGPMLPSLGVRSLVQKPGRTPPRPRPWRGSVSITAWRHRSPFSTGRQQEYEETTTAEQHTLFYPIKAAALMIEDTHVVIHLDENTIASSTL